MLCSRFRFLHLRSRLQSGLRSKSCLSNNSKTTEANLKKLHRKIEHTEKVCCAQELGSNTQSQGNNWVRGQIAPNRKVKQNDNLCPVQDAGSLAVFKVTARDQDHYKRASGAFVTYCNISCFFFMG